MRSRARSCVTFAIIIAIAGCGSRVSLGFDIESGGDAGTFLDGTIFDTSTAPDVSVIDDAEVDASTDAAADDDVTIDDASSDD